VVLSKHFWPTDAKRRLGWGGGWGGGGGPVNGPNEVAKGPQLAVDRRGIKGRGRRPFGCCKLRRTRNRPLRSFASAGF